MEELNEVVEYCLQQIENKYPSIIDNLLLFIKMSDKYTEVFSKLEESSTPQYEYVNFYDTLDRVKEFLSIINPEYLDIFDKCIEDGTFDFVDLNDGESHIDYAVCQEDDDRAKINIPINNNSLDGSNIIHEFFHYLNYENVDKKIVESREIFTEFISAYYELRYDKFVSDKYYGQEFFKNELISKLDDIFYNANLVLLSGAIFDSYINTSDVSKESIVYVDESRHIYRSILDRLEGFKDSDDFFEILYNFDESVSYLLGLLLAVYSFQNYTLSDIKVDYINKNFNILSTDDILNLLMTSKNEYKYWILSCLFKYYDYSDERIEVKEVLSSLGITLDDYQKFMNRYLMDGEVNEEINSYSRANRSRKN